MRFGLTLRMDLFAKEPGEASRMLLDTFGGKEGLFSYLKETVNAVEISAIGSKNDPQLVLDMVRCCTEYGLEVTVHGILKEEEPAEDFFVPYLPLFRENLQRNYNITLHPLKEKEDTIRALKELCSYAEERDYPVTFTLENQRLAHDYSVNGICQSVGEIVKTVDSDRLHTCFDFGHHLSNKRKQGVSADPFDQEFADRIRHTHIHSMYEGATHFPLYCGETELDQNLMFLIEKNYDGILLLEIAFQRFVGEFEFRDALCRSVEILKNAYAQMERKVKEIRLYQEDYPKLLAKAAEELEELRCGVVLLSPSSYLLKFEDTKIAVDPSLFDIPVSQEGRKAFFGLVKACDGVIYTHKHADHYDSAVARDIAESGITWFVPDFLSEADIQGGKLAEKHCVMTQKDREYDLKNVHITCFESCHSSGENRIPEYGFAITFEGKNYVFPVDVRNYDTGLVKQFPHTEVLFAHLWLGREKALEPDTEYIRQFTDFVNAFDAKRVCLGHVFDVRREVCDMWTDLHYRHVEGKVAPLIVLRPGMTIPL